MHERTPEEESTSCLATTALALARDGATPQEICNAIDADSRNANLTLSRRQLGLMAQYAAVAARNEREGRRPPTTTPDAPQAQPPTTHST